MKETNKARLIWPKTAIEAVIMPTIWKYGKETGDIPSALRAIIEITEHNLQVIMGMNPSAKANSERNTKVTGMGQFRASRK